MLETTLSQLEQLVSELVEQNRVLTENNAQINAQLAQAKEENESLQLTLMEQEEKQTSTVSRIQALVQRASAGAVSA